MHLALGKSYPETGGVNTSALHWDLVCDLRTESEVYADGELVYRDGRFLDDPDRAPRRHAHAARDAGGCRTAASSCSPRPTAILHVGDFTAASVLEELQALAPVTPSTGTWTSGRSARRCPSGSSSRWRDCGSASSTTRARRRAGTRGSAEWFPGCDAHRLRPHARCPR